MGKILSTYNKIIVEEITNSILSNTSQYYAFGGNPVAYGGSVPEVSNNDYDSTFTNNWLMMFGKQLKFSDVAPVIKENTWVSNTAYEMYDNTSDTLLANANFYVVSPPSDTGGNYHIYKCIDNANNAKSTVNPSSVGDPTQQTTFQTADSYKWRYITSISSKNHDKFSSNNHIPVYTNTTISAAAANYSGVDVVMLSNSGSGYDTHHTGVISSVVNATMIQIASDASGDNGYYVNNAVYIYNTADTTAQLLDITGYTSNSGGKWISVTSSPNTDNITAGVSLYRISPKVLFNSDGDVDPSAYTTVNTSTNSIHSVVMIESGSDVSWANVSIQSNSIYGSGANVYAIVPPAGGHGFDAVSELDVKGLGINFSFENTESANIVTSNVVFNKIGIVKNPKSATVNSVSGVVTEGSIYEQNAFDQHTQANVSPSYVFTVGVEVVGNTSGSRGFVSYSNSTQVYIIGDQTFSNGEYITHANGLSVTTIDIKSSPDVYNKNLKPFYLQTINNTNRADDQTENFKLIITT